ncbi:MAG: glycosyltransferase, partial [Anaerolineae bacterium]
HPFSAEVGTGIFEELRAALKRSERVIIKPMIPHDELIQEYSTAHVAIDLMKRNPERELAFTTRTVEYLWCGLPVIYNDYSELSSYVREYEAGWVVNPEDKEEIAKAIEGILKSPEIVRQRSENAQRLVRENFTWDRRISPLDAFCRSPFIRRRRSEAPMQREKPFRELMNEAITHYQRGGIQRLSKETLLFLRRRLIRRS